MHSRLFTRHILFTLAALFIAQPSEAMLRRANAMQSKELKTLLAFVFPAAHIAGTFLTSNFAYANRGVFLNCNEENQHLTFEQARLLKARGNVGIGTSALFNLNLFLARSRQGIKDWVLVDPAPEVQSFWRKFKEVFERAHDLDMAFEMLEASMAAECNRYFTPMFLGLQGAPDFQYERWLSQRLTLAKEQLREFQAGVTFRELRALITDHLILIPTDLTSNDEVKALIAFLSEHQMTVDTLYVSNINMSLNDEALAQFRTCCAGLRWHTAAAEPAYLIEAGPRVCGDNARMIAIKSYQRVFNDWMVE